MKRVALGEINDRSRVWRPTSSQKTPGARALGVARFNVRIRKGVRLRREPPDRRESEILGRPHAARPSGGAFRPPRSPFLSLTADHPVNAHRAVNR